eukprot:gene1150-1524_t
MRKPEMVKNLQSKRAYFARLAVISTAAVGAASARADAVDVAKLLADIAAQATPIAAVGGAVLLIHLGVTPDRPAGGLCQSPQIVGFVKGQTDIGGGMANIYRLILIIFVAFFSGPIFAQQCQAYRVVLGGWDSGAQSSPSLACAAMAGKSGDDLYTSWSVTTASLQSDTACVLKITTTWKNDPNRVEQASRLVPVGGATVPCGCPVGMEISGSSCVCKPGLEKGPDGLCVPSEDTECK